MVSGRLTVYPFQDSQLVLRAERSCVEPPSASASLLHGRSLVDALSGHADILSLEKCVGTVHG